MMRRMEPPEPTCPRCGEYIDENDQKYCPCGAELDPDDVNDWQKLICPECHRLLDVGDIEWRCPKCGYDGKPKNCAVCADPLHPKRDCLCAKCAEAENRAAFEDYDDNAMRFRR